MQQPIKGRCFRVTINNKKDAMHGFSSSDQDRVFKGHYQDSVSSTEQPAWIPLSQRREIYPSRASVEYCQRSAININKCCGSDMVVTPYLEARGRRISTYSRPVSSIQEVPGKPNYIAKTCLKIIFKGFLSFLVFCSLLMLIFLYVSRHGKWGNLTS